MAAFADANPILPVYRGELQCRSLGVDVQVFDEDGNAVVGAEGRAGLHQAVSLDAARLLERPRRRALPRGLLRALPERLVPRRLVRAHRARHDDRLRPLGRDPQPGRRAHRHCRDLRARSRRSTRSTSRWRSASSGRPTRPPTRAWCCSSSCAPGSGSMQRSRSASASRSATTPRRATCRRRSCRCEDIPRTKNGKVVELAVRAVVNNMPVGNTDALANPEALELFRDLPELQA